ncbi:MULTISPECIES: SPOR domain-containing protein [unclassified Herbaspirillum]|uniref:SPOR domain-containing protein n=1 Tax=unclassified Herbaspirillum TaxID=2624150 RepID=UPI00114FAF83|nr:MULTISPECIES: SPOR domain-containing protein [unclassified Herbaspirillum]MBB5391927.1 DedD protein [Herbaspirillum sp. SJZ102]TQK13387.1 DedD protein [Herbaspirillum sp. SJZ130]TQK15391.1 DedD protein [Herbaspirillum sp. SJZ106]TWC71286.1 DedD protein [Herbaspirillum sp. SJZ099]
MGLFSFFRKNKQESASDQGEFRSRSAEETSVLRSRSNRASNTPGRAPGGRGKAGKEAAADPLLPEKKRARRRLIGAVALALAVVIVLPMILDSEPKSLNEDIAIQIPSKDQPAANAIAGGAQSDQGAQPGGEKLASAASALDQKEEIVEPTSVNPAPAAAAQAAPAAPSRPAEKPAAKPEEKKPAAAERKEEAKKEAPKKETPKPKAAEQGDDARALAILEGKSASGADKKPAAAGGKFVIQVAALATQDKVNELRNKLSGAGIHSFTQKIATQSGDRTRIRVGPFASRDEAEKMGARIKKLGLNATIIPA